MSERLSPFATIFVVTFFGRNQFTVTQNFNSYLVRKLKTVCNELQQIITRNSLLHVLLAMFYVMLFPYTLVIP